MEPLQPVFQHRPIRLFENIWANLNDVVRTHTDNLRVERRMMELAQRQPVRDARFTLGIGIGDDVSRFEQFLVSQSADRAVLPIGRQHALTECLLVEPLAHEPRDVATANVSLRC
jgi:hypothetical protein